MRTRVVYHHVHLPSFPNPQIPPKYPSESFFPSQNSILFHTKAKSRQCPLITAPWNAATSRSLTTRSRHGRPFPGNTARSANWCYQAESHYHYAGIQVFMNSSDPSPIQHLFMKWSLGHVSFGQDWIDHTFCWDLSELATEPIYAGFSSRTCTQIK